PSRKNDVLRLITARGQISFRPVRMESKPPCAKSPTEPAVDQAATLPQLVNGRPVACFLLEPSRLDGSIIEEATAVADAPTRENWVVRLTFNPAGARQFDELTATLLNGRLAIGLDGRILAAPLVRSTGFNGAAEISG